MSTENPGTTSAPETNPVTPPAKPSAVADTVKGASKDAVAAIKLFAANPVAGLPPAYAAMGEAKAMRVGIAFGVVSVLCLLLGAYLLFPFKEGLFDFLGFGGVLKAILFAAMPFLGAAAGAMAVRKAVNAQGGLGSDCFIAGAALLPIAIWAVISGLASYRNPGVIGFFMVFAGCTTLLMMFSGYTRIMKTSERVATVSIPIVIIVTLWITQTLAESIMGGARF